MASQQRDSMPITSMLRQALRGHDNQLLMKALEVKDQRVISKSLIELKASEAAALLQAIVKQIQESPLLSSHRHLWLQLLLRHHAHILASIPQVKESLEILAEHAQQRIANQNALLRLLGRTEVILFQAERRIDSLNNTSTVYEDAMLPLVTFQE